MPHVDQSPTHEEDLSTKPGASRASSTSGRIVAAAWIETHLNLLPAPGHGREQITACWTRCGETKAYENTIVIFSSDHGDMQGAHGGMHEKWHVAYDEALDPVIVSSPLLPGGARELDIPTNHADLIPTLLGLDGIDHDEALADSGRARDARPLVGRDLATRSAPPSRLPPSRSCSQPTMRSARAAPGARARSPASHAAAHGRTVEQPNHIETVIAEVDVDGKQHLVKFSRYHDNQQFWTVPGERDERLRGRKTNTVTEPEPDEYELYDLTTRWRSATSRTPAMPTIAPAPSSRRCSRSSSSSSPPNASRLQPVSPPAIARPLCAILLAQARPWARRAPHHRPDHTGRGSPCSSLI